MLVVVALGGNALLKRGDAMTAENQRAQRARRGAARWRRSPSSTSWCSRTATGRRSACSRCRAPPTTPVETYPLDVLGAQTEGMIGYMIEQELGNLLPFERPLATLLTMVEVDPDDPAFQNPTKFIGPIYPQRGGATGWPPSAAGSSSSTATHWRRVVASPEPKRIFELRPIRWLLRHGAIVIAPAAAASRPCTCTATTGSWSASSA